MSFLTSLLRPTTLPTLPPLSSPSSTFLRPLSRAFSTTPSQRVARMTIVGRLADSPELMPTATGRDVIRYALGTSTGSRENRSTSWWRVAYFPQEGALREVVLGLGKGSLVYVEGDCSMSKFTDKEGKPTSALSIVQRHIEVMDKRNSEGEGEGERSSDGEGEGE